MLSRKKKKTKKPITLLNVDSSHFCECMSRTMIAYTKFKGNSVPFKSSNAPEVGQLPSQLSVSHGWHSQLGCKASQLPCWRVPFEKPQEELELGSWFAGLNLLRHPCWGFHLELKHQGWSK